MRVTPENIVRLSKNQILVNPTNLAGIHGKGIALLARKIAGATLGRCHGMDNQSYGLPTRDANFKTLSLDRIGKYADNFMDDAEAHSDLIFLLPKVGCGNAGYTPEEIAPLFRRAMTIENIWMPQEFWDILNREE